MHSKKTETIHLDSQGKHITTDCDIAKNTQFESGVIKILNDEEMTMSVGTGLACRMLRKNPIPEDDDVIVCVCVCVRERETTLYYCKGIADSLL